MWRVSGSRTKCPRTLGKCSNLPFWRGWPFFPLCIYEPGGEPPPTAPPPPPPLFSPFCHGGDGRTAADHLRPEKQAEMREGVPVLDGNFLKQKDHLAMERQPRSKNRSPVEALDAGPSKWPASVRIAFSWPSTMPLICETAEMWAQTTQALAASNCQSVQKWSPC